MVNKSEDFLPFDSNKHYTIQGGRKKVEEKSEDVLWRPERKVHQIHMHHLSFKLIFSAVFIHSLIQGGRERSEEMFEKEDSLKGRFDRKVFS